VSAPEPAPLSIKLIGTNNKEPKEQLCEWLLIAAEGIVEKGNEV
jgi:hypothetical protein